MPTQNKDEAFTIKIPINKVQCRGNHSIVDGNYYGFIEIKTDNPNDTLSINLFKNKSPKGYLHLRFWIDDEDLNWEDTNDKQRQIDF